MQEFAELDHDLFVDDLDDESGEKPQMSGDSGEEDDDDDGHHADREDVATDSGGEEDGDEDEIEEMDFIGRLPFLSSRRPVFSFDYTQTWLYNQYRSFHGEPRGIVPATEPEAPPPIQQVEVSRPQRVLARQRYRRNTGEVDSAIMTPKEELALDQPVTESMLRSKIMEIKKLNVSDRERDRLVQRLMTAHYYRLRNTSEGLLAAVQADNAESSVKDEPVVGAEDLVKTYHDKEAGILGCKHYQRRCKVECSTCGRWYTCRMCHDAVENHTLVRPQTRHVLCMQCGTPQASSKNCTKCHTEFARYYCDVCKLWDDAPDKSIYHCPDCTICRIGRGLGIDLFHCPTCNVCMSIELEGHHKCIEHSTECNCPICGEFMFTSTETVVFMKCGHSIHQSCYLEHVKTSYKCPTCARSIVNMAAQFRILDQEIMVQPLPEPYDQWRCIIVCNDCSARSDVPFHFLGLKCANCGSYNTAQLKLIKPEEDPACNEGRTTNDDYNTLMFSPEASRPASGVATPQLLPPRHVDIVDISEQSDFDENDDAEEQTANEIFANLFNRLSLNRPNSRPTSRVWNT
ncbi:hypothetical protein TRVA0_018S02036 [Trichomonascus vanleenenianus]|uniref:RING finger and CHY zinc finger domain-containing protein n=1 Tax=Trichomonascus vanleenenianus TaxID=2268995 RepID=UPI003ECAD751